VLGDIDLVRPLGIAGIRCAVVARPTGLARHSRFTDVVIEWADPWAAPRTVLSRLLDFGARQASAPVLYYQDDCDLLLVSRNRAALSESFRFVVPDPELVEDHVDKAASSGSPSGTACPCRRPAGSAPTTLSRLTGSVFPPPSRR